jgi:hypothetical protein
MTAPALPLPALVGVGAFIAWRVVSRVRRVIGRQRFRPVRSRLAATVFPLLAALLLAGAWRQPVSMTAELAGIAIGIGLAFYGLRLTRFEDDADGTTWYTPNAHIGVALSLLMVGRMGYRMWQLVYGAAGTDPQAFGRSPATLLIFGMLAGYYATYAIGLLARPRPAPLGA